MVRDAGQNSQRELDRLRNRVSELEHRLQDCDSDEGLRLLFDDMFEGIQIIDRDFRYHYVNQTAADHGRRRREELVGRHMDEMYPGIEETELFGLLRRCMQERTGQRLVNHFIYPDGASAWFDLRLSPVPMGVLILSVDISREVTMTEEARHSREILATTLDCMADAVVTTDTGGRVTSWNPAAEQLTGCPAVDAIGRPVGQVLQFLVRGADDAVPDPTARMLEGQSDSLSLVDVDLVVGDGRRVPVVGSGAPLRGGDGAFSGIVLALKDMTDEVALTERLEQSHRLESIGRLAGGVAHDFNNMLTVIQGYCTMALGDRPAPEVREGLEEINRAADRAAGLTQQLLAFSRRQVLKPVVLDLNSVVGDLDRMLRRTLGEDIDLVVRLEDALDHVLADRGKIEQVVVNLAINARDAMPHGGKLTIETANVPLDVDYSRAHADVTPGPHVMLAVSDTGVGIPPESLSLVFEPFYTTKSRERGTGLGLATVYGIVKQSGGQISVYSELDEGTTFKLYFPATEAELDPHPARVPDMSRLEGTETILIVEDEQSVRRLIRRVLERSGYHVLGASAGDEALDICRRYGPRIDLVLTDVVLPGIGGRDLANEVTANWPDIRVVFMSGYTDNAIVHRGVLAPGTAFIPKPVRPEHLLRRLRRYLDVEG